MKIGLFFGSFNPIHNGHLAIADFMAGKTDLDEVWFMVSPHNPLKKEDQLLDESVRLKLVETAVRGNSKIKVSDEEFHLPKPSYTINTLSFLKKKFPLASFVLLLGEDNLRNFHLWREYEKILSGFQVYVYPRKVTEHKKNEKEIEIIHSNVKKFDVPLLDISATRIRESIKKGQDVSPFLPQRVSAEILRMNYYR